MSITSTRISSESRGSLLKTLIDADSPVRFMLKCDACDTEFYEVEEGQVITNLPECCEAPHIVMALISQLPTNDEEEENE